MRVVLILAAAVLLFAAIYVLVLVRPTRRGVPAELCCDYAHRGLHGGGIPENSLPAFLAAVESGVGIELDVRLSRDGEVMVFHDASLLRMTGCDRKVAQLSREELSALTLGGTTEHIPTFREVLSLVDGQVPLMVELKGEAVDTALCDAVAAQLADYPGPVCVESFNPLLVRGMAKRMPTLCRGQLYSNFLREKENPSILDALLSAMVFNFLSRPDFISVHKKCRKSLPVRIATEFFRAPRFLWTVVGEREIAEAKDRGECPIFELDGREK